MIATEFDYHLPTTEAEAAAILSRAGETARVLGGGTALVPTMTAGAVRPTAIVDLRKLALTAIAPEADGLTIGARATYSDVLASSLVETRLPLLYAMAKEVTGGRQLLNQGTLGGSACYANPASDVPACLVALDARMHAVSQQGTRDIPANDFFIDAFRTALRVDEFLSGFFIPCPAPATRSAYVKFKFCTSSWPIVTAACLVPPSGPARIAIGGAAIVPLLLETPLNAARISDEELADIGRRATAAVVHEWTDELAEPGYRRAIVGSVVRRALRVAYGQDE